MEPGELINVDGRNWDRRQIMKTQSLLIAAMLFATVGVASAVTFR
jgi:hypothetical protein